MPRCAAGFVTSRESNSAAFGLTIQNLALEMVEIFEDVLRPIRCRSGSTYSVIVSFEIGAMAFHRFVDDTVNIDQFLVYAVDEVAVEIEHIGNSAGHAGAEVVAGVAENRYHAAGHVFAAVVADALDDRVAPELRTAKRSPAMPGRHQRAAGGAVEAGIADDRASCELNAGEHRWANDDAAAGHALADVVVGVALEVHVQAAGVPDTEALAGGAGELQRIGCSPMPWSPCARAISPGQGGADRAMGIVDG